MQRYCIEDDTLKPVKAWIITLMALGFSVAGCSLLSIDSGAQSLTSLNELSELDLPPGEILRVVVTTSILGDVVANVAGENVDLQILLPPGTDPHAYQPTPRDLTAIAQAHVVFINGLGLEIFLEDMLSNAGGQAVFVSLSEGVSARRLDSHDINLDPEHDDEYAVFDAHVWLDPANVEIWVDNAQAALATLDPRNAAHYFSAASSYKASLQELHTWIQEQVAQIPEADRKLLGDHMALGYFADGYGFRIAGAVIPAYNTTVEISAQELAALQQAIQTAGIKAVFVATSTNPTISLRLASDLGLQLVSLYIGSLSDASGPAASYLDLMHYNVEAIVNALQP
jgi:ABC-type Zn uptake system ZnuABC Zn-binding protein ZnuA